MTTFTLQDLTTPEEDEAWKAMEKQTQQPEVIQGATGAQYQFMDTSPEASQVRNIVNNICRELQALATVITSYQSNANTIKQLLDATIISNRETFKRTEGEDDCGK